MGTVDRDCGGAQSRAGVLVAGTARPWHALTVPLLVVVCWLVWLCIRQCHELILNLRVEQSESGRARLVAGADGVHRHDRIVGMASQGSLLGLATMFLVTPVEPQQGKAAEALPGSDQSAAFLLSDSLDFSTLDAAHLATVQCAISFASPRDQTGDSAGAWGDQQAVGIWTSEFGGDAKA